MAVSSSADAPSGAMSRRARWRVLFAIGALYAGFGLMTALLQGGLPPILRARGMSMTHIAWTFALYLPLGLSFLWAPLIDRIRLPFLSPRIGWIVAAQAVAVAGLVAVAWQETAPLAVLFGLGLIIAMAVATMDLALDAMVVEMTGANTRPIAASLKLAALATGAMIGGGVFVGLLATLGWTATFSLAALLMALALVPAFGLAEDDRRLGQRHAVVDTRLYAAFRQPAMLLRLGGLVCIASLIFPLSALNRVMLVDLGVSLERIAWLVGTAQPLGLLAVSLCAAPLIRRLGERGAFLLFAVAGLVCLALMGFGYQAGAQAAGIAGAIGISAAVGGMVVVNASLMLVWAQGPQTATNYAVMFCGSRLAGIVATVLAGKLVAILGWSAFYALGAAGALLAAAVLLACLRVR